MSSSKEFVEETIKIVRNSNKVLLLIYFSSIIIIFSYYEAFDENNATTELTILRDFLDRKPFFLSKDSSENDMGRIEIKNNISIDLLSITTRDSDFNKAYKDSLLSDIFQALEKMQFKLTNSAKQNLKSQISRNIYLPYYFESAPNINEKEILPWFNFLSREKKITIYKPIDRGFQSIRIDSIYSTNSVAEISEPFIQGSYIFSCYVITDKLECLINSEKDESTFTSGDSLLNGTKLISDFYKNQYDFNLRSYLRVDTVRDYNSYHTIITPNTKGTLPYISKFINELSQETFETGINKLNNNKEEGRKIDLVGFDVSYIFLAIFLPIIISFIFLFNYLHLKPLVNMNLGNPIFPWSLLYKNRVSRLTRVIFYCFAPFSLSITLLLLNKEIVTGYLGGTILFITFLNFRIGMMIVGLIKEIEIETDLIINPTPKRP